MSSSYRLEILKPKATGNIIQDQLDRLKELWERVAADDSWAMSASFLNCIPSSTITNVVFGD